MVRDRDGEVHTVYVEAADEDAAKAEVAAVNKFKGCVVMGVREVGAS